MLAFYLLSFTIEEKWWNLKKMLDITAPLQRPCQVSCFLGSFTFRTSRYSVFRLDAVLALKTINSRLLGCAPPFSGLHGVQPAGPVLPFPPAHLHHHASDTDTWLQEDKPFTPQG
jgi:hypothetical protein